MKPPLNPLKAGWVICSTCNGRGEFSDPHHHVVAWECGQCHGEGIVVGPSADGLGYVGFMQMVRSTGLPYDHSFETVEFARHANLHNDRREYCV